MLRVVAAYTKFEMELQLETSHKGNHATRSLADIEFGELTFYMAHIISKNSRFLLIICEQSMWNIKIILL